MHSEVFKKSLLSAKSLQSCPTLCDPIDGSPSGSSAHGILQARVLEWGAIAFSEIFIFYKWKDVLSFYTVTIRGSLILQTGLPQWLSSKEYTCNTGDTGLIMGGEDPLEKEMETYSSIHVWEYLGQRSLVGYSPWGGKIWT